MTLAGFLDAVVSYATLASLVLIPVGILVWWLAVVIVPRQGTMIYEVLGEYRGPLEPGIHLVWPFISAVTFVDDRRKVFEVVDWEYETRGGETVSGEVQGEMQVADLETAYFEGGDQAATFWRLLHESMEAEFADRWAEDVLDDPDAVAAALEQNLEDEATRVGIDVGDVDLSDLRTVAASDEPAGVATFEPM